MNRVYEEKYERNILNSYGNYRNEEEDIQLEKKNNKNHSYKINRRLDMTNIPVYSVDPPGCQDADDAFSIYKQRGKYWLAIHIADPTEYIDIESDLWTSILDRIITRYPSNHKPMHMMPDDIMDKASLMVNKYGNIKNAVSVITEIEFKTFKPINQPKLHFTKISVEENNAKTYFEASKEAKDYNSVFFKALRIAKQMNIQRNNETLGTKLGEILEAYPVFDNENDRVYLYLDTPQEKSMKNMIAEFAIFANTFVGSYLKTELNGLAIYRACNATNLLQEVDENVTGRELLDKIIDTGIKGTYVAKVEAHDLVGKKEYCHFTSPIRRVTDCICHYLLKYINLKQKNKNLEPPFTKQFLDKTSEQCDIVTKKTKKIQFFDTKFRMIQAIDNILNEIENNTIGLKFKLASYNNPFLNVVITKIGKYPVHVCHSLKFNNVNKEIDHNKEYYWKIHKVNILEKFDYGTIPELERKVKNIIYR